MLVMSRCHKVPCWPFPHPHPLQDTLYLTCQAELLTLIEAELVRRQSTWEAPKHAARKRFPPVWCSQLMEQLPVTRLLADPELLQLLPPGLANVGLLLAP